mmetsp:Transcript_28253/g.47395  ORF Transcript_28253/g.47395 Transcript_28253/m.47395 type:complete len:119 (-) Transcript_28253:163-519(-)
MSTPAQALQLAAVASSGYSIQMALAPEFANDLYYKKGHPLNKNVSRWFGHALAGLAVAQGLASKEGTPNKAVLMASAFQYGTAPLMMLYQEKDMKKEMIIANSILCAGIGFLCFKQGK